MGSIQAVNINERFFPHIRVTFRHEESPPHIDLKIACIYFYYKVYCEFCFRILALSSHSVRCPLSVVRGQASHPTFSPLYGVLDHTNQIFSVRIWSWQCVSNIQDKYKDKYTHKDKYKDKDVRNSRVPVLMYIGCNNAMMIMTNFVIMGKNS